MLTLPLLWPPRQSDAEQRAVQWAAPCNLRPGTRTSAIGTGCVRSRTGPVGRIRRTRHPRHNVTSGNHVLVNWEDFILASQVTDSNTPI